jgi:hypothetical protein
MFLKDSHTDPADTPQGSPEGNQFKPTLVQYVEDATSQKCGAIHLYEYEFSHPFEPLVEACTSFYVGILSQKESKIFALL